MVGISDLPTVGPRDSSTVGRKVGEFNTYEPIESLVVAFLSGMLS